MRQSVALDTQEIVGRVKPRKLALEKLMNQRAQLLRLIEGADSDRKISSFPGQRVSLGEILAVQSGPAFSAEMAPPGCRCGIDSGAAASQPERIAGNSRR